MSTSSLPLRLLYADVMSRIGSLIAIYALSLLKNTKLVKRIAVVGVVGAVMASTMVFGNADGIDTVQYMEATTNVSTFSVNQLIADITQSIDTAIGGLSSNQDLRGFGRNLAAFLVVALMIWSGVKIMASGKGLGELIADWAPIWLAFGMYYLLVEGDGVKQLARSMDSLGSAIGGPIASSVGVLLKTTVVKLLGIAKIVFEMPIPKAGLMEQALTGTIMLTAVMWLGVWLVKVFIGILIMLMGVVYIAIAVFAMISVALCGALAPLMIPFIIWPAMDWIFHSWLKYLLGACMMKIVGAFMLKLTENLFAQMATVVAGLQRDVSNSPADALIANMVSYSALLLLAVLAVVLMSQVPGIATGLLQGNASGGGFRGIGAATNNPAVRAASGATSSAAAGGVNAVKSAYQNTVGVKSAASRGASDAASKLPSSVGKGSFANARQERAYMTSHARGSAQIKSSELAAKTSNWRD